MKTGNNPSTISWMWDPSPWFPPFCWIWSQEESTGAKPLSESISERDIRNLHKTLARMNFSNLICLVTHQSPNRAGLFPESAERLSAALERLRPRLSPMRELEGWMLRMDSCCLDQSETFWVSRIALQIQFTILWHVPSCSYTLYTWKGLYSAVPLWFLAVSCQCFTGSRVVCNICSPTFLSPVIILWAGDW